MCLTSYRWIKLRQFSKICVIIERKTLPERPFSENTLQLLVSDLLIHMILGWLCALRDAWVYGCCVIVTVRALGGVQHVQKDALGLWTMLKITEIQNLPRSGCSYQRKARRGAGQDEACPVRGSINSHGLRNFGSRSCNLSRPDSHHHRSANTVKSSNRRSTARSWLRSDCGL
uniref:Uncharacterized protein n=1 Tax=Ditylenchus dipsaci TaxID=166011 RepID=A0A915EFH5_9BILA